MKAVETAGGKACLVSKTFRLLADAWGQNENHLVARDLQHHLDGYVGTMGDVAAYRRVIDMLAESPSSRTSRATSAPATGRATAPTRSSSTTTSTPPSAMTSPGAAW